MSTAPLQAMTPEPTVFSKDVLDTFLVWAVEAQVSDIVLRTDKPPHVTLHGDCLPALRRRLTTHDLATLIDTIYIKSASAQLMGGEDLDFAYEYKVDRVTRHRFRCNATAVAPVEGTGQGIDITFRVIPSVPPNPSDLNLEDDIINVIENNSDGLFLVAGPTGSGKTTLLAACIGHMLQQSPGQRILTYEAPIEFNLSLVPNAIGLISQSEIPRHLPGFAAGIRNALRRAPDTILIGESRDKETIEGTVRASQTGHFVLSTVHTAGVPSTIPRMIDEFNPEDRHSISIKLIDIMRGIVYQRLVPSTDGKRVALREYLMFTPEIRDELIRSISRGGVELQDLLRAELNKSGCTLYNDAEIKFNNNQIDDHQFQLIEKEYNSGK